MNRVMQEADVLVLATSGPVSPARRALALAGAGGIEAAAELPLGARDAALMRLRALWFGADCPCEDTCPACGRRVEFTAPLPALAEAAAPTPGSCGRFAPRPLTTADILSIEGLPRAEARLALARAATGSDDLTAAEIGQVEDWLMAADPLAHVVFDLTCAHCAAAWSSPFDIVRHLWADLAGAGRRLLAEIHVLASAYHWTEAEILAVPPARRRAYLEMIGS